MAFAINSPHKIPESSKQVFATLAVILTRRFISGGTNGLSMTLNIEEYEYMSGPHQATGLKLLLQEEDSVPFVDDLGDQLPTGLDSFVAIRPIKVFGFTACAVVHFLSMIICNGR
jgi:hypothetical protein